MTKLDQEATQVQFLTAVSGVVFSEKGEGGFAAEVEVSTLAPDVCVLHS